MSSLGKGLEICSGAGCGNPDRFTVTIKSVDNKNRSTSASSEPDEGCGPSRACVKSAVAGDHKRTMHMIFEDPPYCCRNRDEAVCDTADLVLTRWTSEPMKHWTWVTEDGKDILLEYPLKMAMHEFGHTLGLPDFYGYDNQHRADGLSIEEPAFLNKSWEAKTVRIEDIEQLDAIYTRHSKH